MRITFDVQTVWDRRISMIDKAVKAAGASRGVSVNRTTTVKVTSKLTMGKKSPVTEMIAVKTLRFQMRCCSTVRRPLIFSDMAGSQPKYFRVRMEPRYSVILESLASVARITDRCI